MLSKTRMIGGGAPDEKLALGFGCSWRTWRGSSMNLVLIWCNFRVDDIECSWGCTPGAVAPGWAGAAEGGRAGGN